MDGADDVDRALTAFVDTVTTSKMEHWTEGTLTDLGRRLAQLKILETNIRQRLTDVEDTLAMSMETDSFGVAGFGELRRVEVKTSRWRDGDASNNFRHDVGETVVMLIARDVATGELDPLKRNVARATVAELWDVIPAFADIKARGRQLGINMRNYRDFDTRYKVDLFLEEEA